MMWQALSRLIAVRLVLLVTIAAAGPAGVASSWHSLTSIEHRAASPSLATESASIEAGALPPSTAAHCAACQFGATLRAWTPATAPSSLAPIARDIRFAPPRVVVVRELPAGVQSGRAPPRAS